MFILFFCFFTALVLSIVFIIRYFNSQDENINESKSMSSETSKSKINLTLDSEEKRCTTLEVLEESPRVGLMSLNYSQHGMNSEEEIHSTPTTSSSCFDNNVFSELSKCLSILEKKHCKIARKLKSPKKSRCSTNDRQFYDDLKERPPSNQLASYLVDLVSARLQEDDRSQCQMKETKSIRNTDTFSIGNNESLLPFSASSKIKSADYLRKLKKNIRMLHKKQKKENDTCDESE